MRRRFLDFFLLQAGEKAVACGVTNVLELNELSFIKELHIGYGSLNYRALLQWIGLECLCLIFFPCYRFALSRTVDQLGLDKSIICGKMLLISPNAFPSFFLFHVFGVIKHVSKCIKQ